MKATISSLDELGQLVRNEARQRGISLSAIMRRCVESSLRKAHGERLPWQGIVSDGGCEARPLETMLAKGWADHQRRQVP